MVDTTHTYTPPPDDGKWACSFDGERWSSGDKRFDTREAALAYARDNYADENGLHGYVGRIRYMRPDEPFLSGEHILELCEEHLAEQDDWSWYEDEFIRATPEQAARLTALLEKFFVDEGLVPTHIWAIDDVVSVWEESDGQ